ncbi:MAG: PAS domain S-box protein [Candidatus Hydrogenedentes bacterium]|nr:PAS domain S-box protein [Candidatus Hydrogenedentota bacterium]
METGLEGKYQVDDLLRVLESSRERLADAVAAGDGAGRFRPEIGQLAKQVAGAIESGSALDIQPLRAAGASPAMTERLVRALESESLCLLNERADDPNYAAAERAIRRCIRHTLARPALNSEIAVLLRRLNEGWIPTPSEDTRGLVSFLQGVLAATRDLVLLCDDDGTVLYLNRKGQHATHYTCDDVTAGLSICDFLPEEYVAVATARYKALAGPDALPYPIDILDRVDLLVKDGQAIPVEITASPLVTETGCAGMVFVARDLRQELRLQQEYRYSQTYLAGIIAHAPIGIITTDSDLVILDANTASVMLYGAPSMHDMVGQSLPGLNAVPDPEFTSVLKGTSQRHYRTRRRYSFLTRFGATVNCDLLVVPLWENADAPGGVLALMLDISDQMALEQSLIQSEKLQSLGEIMAGVAHELNNPLTGILGYSQLLISAKVDANLKSKLEHITEEATRCRRIVQNLLSFSRHHEPEKSLQQINDLLEQTLSLREYQLRVDGIDLIIELDRTLPMLRVDPHEIQRVFLNIINNAQQALVNVEDRKRTFQIRTFLKDQDVHIRFEDNGPGVPKDKVSRVFDPFFTTKGIGEGTGLGLSVSYGIINAHGGRITLTSSPGQGACFTVVLPTKPPADG